MLENNKYNVSEIFFSIQGEGTHAGLPCIFVRFQGCNLRCSWCDTPYALEINQKEMEMTAEEIFEKISVYHSKLICVTGGEPMLQKKIEEFLEMLCNEDYTVLLETGGSLDLSKVDKRVIKMLDMKAPSSGMTKKNLYSNLDLLNKNDELKIIIASREDFEWSKQLVYDKNLFEKCGSVLLSPAFGDVSTKELADWILNELPQARMNLQIHKFIWGADVRGV